MEYGCGHDNPGVYLKVNEEPWAEIPTTTEEEKPPEFQRGKVSHNFTGREKKTHVIFYVGEEHIPVDVSVLYREKTKVFSISHGKNRKEMVRGVKFDQLLHTKTKVLCLGDYHMKLQAWLGEKKDRFRVELNG